MKNTFTLILMIFLIISIPSSVTAETDDTQETTQTRTSSEGLFKVTISSLLNPLQLGRMHSWEATILTSDNMPVSDAEIKISGGMPIHNHGFPTQPMMTKQLNDGVYLLEGFKFSMGGPWVIVLDISINSQTDTVAFDINM